MGKRQRLRENVKADRIERAAPPVALKLGKHQLPIFGGLDMAFGARLKDYPPYAEIPEQFKRHGAPECKAVSALFFRGGTLADHGRKLKPGVDKAAFFSSLRAMLSSFEPKHEHKEAACAWLMAEYTEPA